MKTALCVLACALGCTGEVMTSEPIVEGPACAEDPNVESARTEDLPWDLARDFDSDQPPECPDDDPACDRLEEIDAPDEPSVLYGLSDPLTAGGQYRR